MNKNYIKKEFKKLGWIMSDKICVDSIKPNMYMIEEENNTYVSKIAGNTLLDCFITLTLMKLNYKESEVR